MRAISVCTCESHLDKLKTVVQNETHYSLFFCREDLKIKRLSAREGRGRKVDRRLYICVRQRLIPKDRLTQSLYK